MQNRVIMCVHLISDALVLLGLILEPPDGGVQALCLALQALHLLPDGVHGWALAGCRSHCK
jgi:hypothetical protein